MPLRVRKDIRIGLCRVGAHLPPSGARNRKKHLLKLFSLILDPALNREVHLVLLVFPQTIKIKNEILI